MTNDTRQLYHCEMLKASGSYIYDSRHAGPISLDHSLHKELLPIHLEPALDHNLEHNPGQNPPALTYAAEYTYSSPSPPLHASQSNMWARGRAGLTRIATSVTWPQMTAAGHFLF